MVLHLVIMPFRRGNALRPVNSIKHILDADGTLLNDGTSVFVPILDTKAALDAVFVPGDVRIGEKVNGIFLSIFIIGATGAPIGASVNWYIIKQHAQQVTFPDPDNTGVSALRNQIFHEEKGLAGSGDGTAMAFKGVIAIPRGMRRMREGDKLFIALQVNAAATGDANFCVKAIYKSYY